MHVCVCVCVCILRSGHEITRWSHCFKSPQLESDFKRDKVCVHPGLGSALGRGSPKPILNHKPSVLKTKPNLHHKA